MDATTHPTRCRDVPQPLSPGRLCDYGSPYGLGVELQHRVQEAVGVSRIGGERSKLAIWERPGSSCSVGDSPS